MPSVLLLTPLLSSNRAVMEHCDRVEAALNSLRCPPRRLDFEPSLSDSGTWWSDNLGALCALVDAVIIVTPPREAESELVTVCRKLIARIPPRTIVWISAATEPHADPVFGFALRQDLNVFAPLIGEQPLTV